MNVSNIKNQTRNEMENGIISYFCYFYRGSGSVLARTAKTLRLFYGILFDSLLHLS